AACEEACGSGFGKGQASDASNADCRMMDDRRARQGKVWQQVPDRQVARVVADGNVELVAVAAAVGGAEGQPVAADERIARGIVVHETLDDGLPFGGALPRNGRA